MVLLQSLKISQLRIKLPGHTLILVRLVIALWIAFVNANLFRLFLFVMLRRGISFASITISSTVFAMFYAVISTLFFVRIVFANT